MKQKMQTWFWPVLGLAITAACATYLLAQTTGGGVAVTVKPNADGTTTVSFQGAADKTYRNYRVESSDDMASWEVVSPDLASSGAVTEWVDMRPAGGTQRFYRVAVVSVVSEGNPPAEGGSAAPPVPAGQFCSMDREPLLASVAGAAEQADAGRLQTALNAGDYPTAAGLLRQYGVSDVTVAAMTARLGQKPARVPLAETFLLGVSRMSFAGSPADVAERVQALSRLGCGRVDWTAQNLDANWMQRYDAELAALPQPPIGCCNVRLNEPDLIRFFLWYDRYAERLHSVCLNGEALNNQSVKTGYDRANQTLNALFQLVKARKPAAFVWLGVTREYEPGDHSDEEWLQAMTFQPDGLQVGGLREFHRPFDETRERYRAVVGDHTPLVIREFFGYGEIWDYGRALLAASQISDAAERQAALAAARRDLAAMGHVLQPGFARLPEVLSARGYRGLSGSWLYLQALHEAQAAGN